jgi:hypothetical protein
VSIVPGSVGFGHEHAYVPPNDFLTLVSKDALSSGIERLNDTGFVDQDERIDNVVGEGLEPLLQELDAILVLSWRHRQFVLSARLIHNPPRLSGTNLGLRERLNHINALFEAGLLGEPVWVKNP